MIDLKTMAYINAYAVFGAFENLCEIDDEAKKLASPAKPISVRFNVTDGPQAVYSFGNGNCVMTKGPGPADIHLKLFSCEAFNKLVDGKATPLPLKGIFKLGFVTGNFTKIGEILSKYLRAAPEQLKDKNFMKKSTILMANVIGGAICQIANHDKVGKISASRIPDGAIAFEAGDEIALTINCKDGRLDLVKSKCENPRAVMRFTTIETARALFDGKEDAMACIGNGTLQMRGYIPMLMNLNNILGRVAMYLA
ncbi:MAG: hypothetical protein ACOX3U_00185 [Christensenellales bacterium]